MNNVAIKKYNRKFGLSKQSNIQTMSIDINSMRKQWGKWLLTIIEISVWKGISTGKLKERL